MDDPDKDSKFDDLSNTNARLMKEMNDYLAAISYSPGEETNCSCETKNTDNLSSLLYDDDDGPLSARLKIPSISAASSENGNETKNKVRSDNKSLISIDENGESNPSGEYNKYYNDRRVSLQSSGQSDDDSLVAMAKQMDAASVISDPSLVYGPSETNLSLPPPKKLTASIMKKLGQKNNNNRAKAAPSYQAPPRLSTRNPSQLNQQQMPVSLYLRPSESDRRNHCTPPSSLPPSSNENVEITPHNNLTNGKNHTMQTPPSLEEYFTSLDSANTLGDSDRALFPEPETKAKKVWENKGRRHSSSKQTLTRGDNKALRRGADNTHSGKKSRKPYPSNIPHAAKGEGNDDAGEINPAKGTSATSSSSAGGNAVVGRKVKSITKGRSSSGTRRGKKGRKKRQPKRDGDSDEEPMQGKGFNTRIHDKPNIDNKPERISDEDSMRGKGFNTRIHDRPRIENKPERSTEQIPKQPKVQSNKRSHGPSQTIDTEIQMDQCESSDSGDSSSYDSDDQTQIFYESTDDEFDSEEEQVAVGTSVADAVACLNDKRAVTKVKNLFGIR